MVELASVDTRPEVETELPYGLDGDQSVSSTLDARQRNVLAGSSLVVVACLLLAPIATLIGIMTLATVVYFSTVCHRAVMTRRSLRAAHVVHVTDDEARAVPDEALPVYTVLVPAYREAAVIGTLLTNLRALEYPRSRLDVKLILEADDHSTIAAARTLGPDLEIVLVEPGGPRTKPNALNQALQYAQGDLVTIYDAEDVPDPLQLRRAVVGFGRLPPEVACLQAQLTFHDWDENILTRWFTIEYLMWFALFLPGLSATDAPVPLGGTSNHVRREVLEAVGAWDSYNVTEDADLGVRLHRQGWRTAVLGSTTYEEPNNDFVNWMKQRSRWYKGYLQTWLVNLRHPVELWRDLGPGGFAQFNLFVGGTPLLALINPIFWLLTLLWFVGHAGIIQEIFPAPLYHVALFCWVIGNVTVLYITILAARRSSRNSLVWAACLVPVYWVMMSMAAVKAFWQVLAAPSFWEKTTHGLIGDEPPPPSAAPLVPEAAGTAAGTAFMTSTASWVPPAPVGAARQSTNGNGNGHVDAGTVITGASDPMPEWSPAAAARPATAAVELEPARRAARARIGQALRVGGVIAVLLVGYLVLGTGWRAQSAQQSLRSELVTAGRGPLRVGAPLARLEIPAIGLDRVVVEGSGASELDRGPGHVRGSANPGGRGDVVLVGHRVLAGAPFAHLGSLHPGDELTLDAPWGRSRYRVDTAATSADPHVDFTTRGAGRLTLVTSGGGLNPGSRLVVTARLASPVLTRAPAPAPERPRLPGVDVAAIPLLLAALLAGVLAWHARRWFVPIWGRVRGGLVVAPFVALAAYEAFSVVVRLLPPSL